MFAKDFHLLNELYSKKVINELNLGPHGDQPASVGLSVDKPVSIERKCLKCSGDNEECEHLYNDENNASMAKQSVFRIVKLGAMLFDLICKEGELEPWVLAKITDSLSNLESVYSYKDYEQFKHKVESDMINLDEETEMDLYNSISSGGSQILAKIKQLLAKESTETLEELLYDTISILETKKVN